jgi:hypothetical protein
MLRSSVATVDWTTRETSDGARQRAHETIMTQYATQAASLGSSSA